MAYFYFTAYLEYSSVSFIIIGKKHEKSLNNQRQLDYRESNMRYAHVCLLIQPIKWVEKKNEKICLLLITWEIFI